MAEMTVKFTGIPAALRALDRVIEAAEEGAKEFTEGMADSVLDLSQIYVPVDTGKLKRSGRVEKDRRRSGAQATVTYGGSSYGVDYGVYVHEIPPDTGGRWGTGNKHRPPTRYKFLETASLQVFSGAETEIYKYIGRRLERAWR